MCGEEFLHIVKLLIKKSQMNWEFNFMNTIFCEKAMLPFNGCIDEHEEDMDGNKTNPPTNVCHTHVKIGIAIQICFDPMNLCHNNHGWNSCNVQMPQHHKNDQVNPVTDSVHCDDGVHCFTVNFTTTETETAVGAAAGKGKKSD